MDISKTSNKKVISSIKKGDKKVFRAFHQYHYPFLFSYAFRLTGNRHRALLLVSETFIEVWEKRNQIPIKIPLRDLVLVKIHYRHVVDLSKGMPETSNIQPFDPNILSESTLDIKFFESLNKLEEREKAVFKSHCFQGHSTNKISQDQHIPEPEVTTILARALEKLCTSLQQDLEQIKGTNLLRFIFS